MSNINKIHPSRKYTGVVGKTNRANKELLVKDFNNSCGYCGDKDIFLGGINAYHVDHFAPKKNFPELSTTYDNLVYSCPFCNISKSNKWVGRTSEESIFEGRGFVDPCLEEYNHHLYRNGDGEICVLGNSTIGEYMYYELNLSLLRHKYIYKMGYLFELCEKLKMKISSLKKEGKECVKEEEAFCKISAQFMLLFIDQNGIGNKEK